MLFRSTNANCPVTEEFLNLSTGCELGHYYWVEESENVKKCKPVLTKHYTDTTKVINVCADHDGYGCNLYFTNCPVPNNTSYSFYYRLDNASTNCRLRRDFRYFPKNLKLSITDDFNNTATVINSAADTYTNHTSCPQEKKITTQ